MNIAEVAKKVAAIISHIHDDEVAHILEDDLHVEVLEAIAEGRCADPAGCAHEALKTLGLTFSRWYA